MINLAGARPDEYFSPTSGDPIQVTINIPFFDDNPRLNRETLTRLDSFYEAIGFGVQQARSGIPETYVTTDANFGGNQPVITYRMADEKSIANRYQTNGAIHGSEFYEGLGLNAMYDMVEICLILPDNDAVHNSYNEAVRRTKGIFEKHTHVGLREHPEKSGRLEYRFTDPFNVAIRVTSPSALVASVAERI